SVQFTITNTAVVATQLLNIGPITYPAGFAADSSMPFVPQTLAAGASMTFKVQMTAAVGGPQSGTLTIANNDLDENPFKFTVSGTVTTPPGSVVILDNSDPVTPGATYAQPTGSWVNNSVAGRGYKNNLRFANPGVTAEFSTADSDSATWTFTGLAAGTYRVSATWYAQSNRATNARYEVS